MKVLPKMLSFNSQKKIFTKSGNPQSGSSVHCFQFELEFRNVDFCGGRKTGEDETRARENRLPSKKILGTRMRTNNKLKPHNYYAAGSEIRTWATLVGGERSHHCTIPAPLSQHFRQFSSMPCKEHAWLMHDMKSNLVFLL